MTWTINPEPVCGGISIIDENGRGVAIVIQRDEHPTLGHGVTLEEAERRARVMAASRDLLDALESAQMALIGYTHQNDITLKALDKSRSAIAKARGES